MVLVGGWVPYLMSSQYPDAAPSEPLLTKDIDIAVPRELRAGGDSMDRRLRESGLEYSYRSMADPPVVSFVGTLDGCEVEIEFLTDEPGGEEQVLDVGGGLRVQSLHYTSVLLDNTMIIPVEAPDGHLLPVRVPTPAAFVFNKSLTFAQRKTPLKKAKDLFTTFSACSTATRIRCPSLRPACSGLASDILPGGSRDSPPTSRAASSSWTTMASDWWCRSAQRERSSI